MTMNSGDIPRTGAVALVDQLRIHGVRRIFCVPGESYLAVLDALVDAPDIDIVVCRHEGGAAMMADAYGKLTGEPGIVFVTRGPGATNACCGIHVAQQDSTPLIMFIGHVERAVLGREAFQEIDYASMFAPITKWVTRIDDPARVPELVSRAFHCATAGRAGPVVIALPEDMLTETARCADAAPYRKTTPGVAPRHAAEIRALLEGAERPVVILGGCGWDTAACAAMVRFAEEWQVPVCTSFRRNDLFDNGHDHYVGNLAIGSNPDLLRAIAESDLLLVIGTRLSEIASGNYTLLTIPRPAQRTVHIHPDPEELGRVYQTDLGVCASMTEAAATLAAMGAPPARANPAVAALRQSFLAWTSPRPVVGDVQMGEIIAWLRDRLPATAILTNGAGNFAIWPNRFYHYRQLGTILAPTSGSMGYGIPAAVAAKIEHPERLVICFAGDGDFMMSGQELATAAAKGAGIIVILVNNGMYGTIRMHQETSYPGRESATALCNPDFPTLVRAYGGHAERVTRTDQFADAFERATASGGTALIEIVIDPEMISPTSTLSQIRERGEARIAAGQ